MVSVYVVLQRQSDYSLEVPHQHECSCLSVHTTLAAANKAAKGFYAIDEEDEEDWVEKEEEWLSWEDLAGTRIQTDSTGAIRVIQVDGLDESVTWVEKHRIKGTS
jgi:hypothetical protein